MIWIEKAAALWMFFFFVSGTSLTIEYSEPIIGIDLGTTYSSVAVYRNGDIEMIRDIQGVYLNDKVEIIRKDTPSWVSFTDTECLIGKSAKDISHLNLDRTIYDVRRLMGREFDDPDFQREMKMFPYKVINKDGNPHVEVKTRVGETLVYSPKEISAGVGETLVYSPKEISAGVGETLVYSPEEISAAILRKMKEAAEAYLGKEVKDAVITIPGCFSYEKQEAIRHAGNIAGLHVARILNEAIAAAYVYGLDKADDKNILVLDLGGGSFDVSVLYVERVVFEVLATSCNTSLGGQSFDRRVVDYFVQLIKKKYDKDISQEKKDLQELLKECETAKIALSNQTQVLVESDSLLDGIKFSEQLTRSKFEELNIDYFQEMIMMVKRALLDANLTMSDIHEILFVGGSTHIPMVRQLFKDFFAGKEVAKSIDPAEVVVHGAAILGEVLNRAMCQAETRPWNAFSIPWPFCFQKYH